MHQYPVMPEPGGQEGQGGQWPHPIFSRSVNPITIGGGRLYPPITTGPPNFFTSRHAPISVHRDAGMGVAGVTIAPPVFEDQLTLQPEGTDYAHYVPPGH